MFEAVEAGFEVFDDFFCQHIGVGEVVEVGKAFVFDPEDVQTGFVSGNQFFIGIGPPSAFGVVLAPGRFAFCFVGIVVALHKIVEVGPCHGLLLRGMMDVGTVVIVPHRLCPWLFTGRFVDKKQDVGFHSRCVEDPRRQAQDGVDLRGFEELLANGLSGATFKEYVVR